MKGLDRTDIAMHRDVHGELLAVTDKRLVAAGGESLRPIAALGGRL